jgi:hypothetical protein
MVSDKRILRPTLPEPTDIVDKMLNTGTIPGIKLHCYKFFLGYSMKRTNLTCYKLFAVLAKGGSKLETTTAEFARET